MKIISHPHKFLKTQYSVKPQYAVALKKALPNADGKFTFQLLGEITY